ncbi:MAG: rhomboid family intramembrane serine protease [Thermoplasmata archaeon]
MIPLKDENPSRTFPAVTVTLIVINMVVFFYEVSLGRNVEQFVYRMGATPYNIVHVGLSAYPTLFTSMFIHGGWEHVLGNMLYLWIFGDNVEDFLGRIRFIIFYLFCGVVASFAHILTQAGSQIPTIGASGAISGVLGGYILLYPKARVLTLIPLGYFIRLVRLPAVAVLGMWILIQLFSGFASLPGAGARGGVAFFAHIGGFVVGLVLIRLFGGRRQPRRPYYAL